MLQSSGEALYSGDFSVIMCSSASHVILEFSLEGLFPLDVECEDIRQSLCGQSNPRQIGAKTCREAGDLKGP